MKAYVINLPPTVDERLSEIRRRHIRGQLANTGLPYQFVAAVDGIKMTAEDRAGIVDEEVIAQQSRWITPGVVGAVLSHLQAYREILASGASMGLVLEDDVLLSVGFAEMLDSAEPRIARNEIVLLYWRTWPGCSFTTHGADRLLGDVRLMYPLDARKVVCASAYVITADACRTMLHALLPIRAGTDAWGEFHERGAFERLRCAVPRPVGMRSDFKSTVDYHERSGLVGRASTFIARSEPFPLYQLLGWRRALIERRRSRFSIVSEPSPLSHQ